MERKTGSSAVRTVGMNSLILIQSTTLEVVGHLFGVQLMKARSATKWNLMEDWSADVLDVVVIWGMFSLMALGRVMFLKIYCHLVLLPIRGADEPMVDYPDSV